jgi:hypothetical protein
MKKRRKSSKVFQFFLNKIDKLQQDVIMCMAGLTTGKKWRSCTLLLSKVFEKSSKINMQE